MNRRRSVFPRAALRAPLIMAALVALAVQTRWLHADPPPAKPAAAAPAFQADPRPALTPKAANAIRQFRTEHYLPPTLEVPDGFADGGRGMQIHCDGRLTSGRELIQVDRTKDAFLRQYIEHVRGKEFMDLDPTARAVRIGMYVDTLLSRNGGRKGAEAQWDKLDSEYANRGLLLGEIAGIAGAGVCRHRSHLYKILANAAGLKVSNVRGCYQHRGGGSGGHAWNELYLDDGTVLLVDIMNPPRGWKFPSIKEPVALKYLSVGGKPLYEGGKVPWPTAAKTTEK